MENRFATPAVDHGRMEDGEAARQDGEGHLQPRIGCARPRTSVITMQEGLLTWSMVVSFLNQGTDISHGDLKPNHPLAQHFH